MIERLGLEEPPDFILMHTRRRAGTVEGRRRAENGSSKAVKRTEEILKQVGIKLMGYIEPFNHSFKMGTCSLSKGMISSQKPGILHLGAVKKMGLSIKQA